MKNQCERGENKAEQRVETLAFLNENALVSIKKTERQPALLFFNVWWVAQDSGRAGH
jgi:hypothetical protein